MKKKVLLKISATRAIELEGEEVFLDETVAKKLDKMPQVAFVY